MGKKKVIINLAWIIAMLLSSCTQNKGLQLVDTGDTLQLHYAHNLTIVEFPNRTEISIRNPWDTTKVLHHYVLADPSLKNSFSQDKATFVGIPLKRAAVFTSVHCSLLQELGVEESIGGVCDLEYIHLPYIQNGVSNGSIVNLGSGMEPSIEHIMDLQPDALMPSPFENSGGYGRLERLGIPIVECADYMEVSPLARAEWVRFYGRLFGVAERADSLFTSIEQHYLMLRSQAQMTESRPRLIAEKPQSGHWYIPCGQSTMGQMYKDAGARYAFQDLEGSGSISLSIEHVLDRALTAQVWLVKNHGKITRGQICKDTPTLSRIPARMWLCDTSTSGFYEDTPFHPELLLANLIQILHPELGIETKKSYFCAIE